MGGESSHRGTRDRSTAESFLEDRRIAGHDFRRAKLRPIFVRIRIRIRIGKARHPCFYDQRAGEHVAKAAAAGREYHKQRQGEELKLDDSQKIPHDHATTRTSQKVVADHPQFENPLSQCCPGGCLANCTVKTDDSANHRPCPEDPSEFEIRAESQLLGQRQAAVCP